MQALHDKDFPVPEPIDHNRHAIVMSRVQGYPMTSVNEMAHPKTVYTDLVTLVI